MAQITLNYADIVNAADRLSNTSKTMEEKFSEIRNVINSTIPGVWGGTAAENYKDGLEKIMAKFPDFVAAVKNEQNILDTAKQNYGRVDSNAADVTL